LPNGSDRPELRARRCSSVFAAAVRRCRTTGSENSDRPKGFAGIFISAVLCALRIEIRKNGYSNRNLSVPSVPEMCYFCTEEQGPSIPAAGRDEPEGEGPAPDFSAERFGALNRGCAKDAHGLCAGRCETEDTMNRRLFYTLFMAFAVTTAMAQEKIIQTAGREALGEFAPEFARLNDDVLFGEVWSRTDRLGLRDRSLVTLTSLISQGMTDSSLVYHLREAKKNGITRVEISEIITHIAFYAGWPKAWAAFRLAKEVWNEQTEAADAQAAFQREMIFPIGEPNTAYAPYFTGNSYLAPVSTEQVPIANVTFEPRCRNNWHIHRAARGGGQMLIGVAGRGWYQEEGKPAVEILPGTVIHIPANVKHWHGAAADSWFAHLAFELSGEQTSNEWLEPVTDDAYDALEK